MKNFIKLFSVLFITGLLSCSDDSSITSPSGIGGGDNTGGTGSVTFKISHQLISEGYDFDQDGQQDDSFYLTASPSASIKITQVDISIPNDANFDTVQGDGTTVFKANEEVYINSTPFYGVTSGLKFTLKFTGKLSDNDQAFTVTSEYTVP